MLHLTPSGLTSILMRRPPARSPALPSQLMRSDELGRRDALVRIARHAIDDTLPESLATACWEALVHDAEASHLVPLLDALVCRAASGVPPAVVEQVRAVTLRHVTYHRARTTALTEILGALGRRSIPSAVLKGAALAWIIYPSPHLRPMTDIDLLVDASSASDVQAELH